MAAGETPGTGLPFGSSTSAMSPMAKTFGWPGRLRSGSTFHPAGAIEFDAEFARERTGGDARGPQNIFGVDGFAAFQVHATFGECS